jgi:transcriptional regulator with XRE-family HTH domain
MRREELAEASGVSATWITWLEQGREVAASVNALSRLAEALKLNSAERATLFDLAGKRDPVAHDEPTNVLVPGILILPSLLTVPAYLLDHAWTARSWNRNAENLFVGWLDKESTDRNLLKFVFLTSSAQTLIDDWPDRSRRLVAEFRADYSRSPDDIEMQDLINELSAKSTYFAQYWKEQSVLHRDGGARSFNHPVHGKQDFLQTTLLVATQQKCKLVCLAPV